MSESFDELMELLKDVKMTFDVGRNHTHPCTFCAKPADPVHELVVIGTYITGAELSRPVCKNCMKFVEVMRKVAANSQSGSSTHSK
jgi:hypothetical protein